MDISNTFKYHAPNDSQIKRYAELRDCARNMALLIDDHCPGSREKAIALTKLQETVMFANASIAINEADDSEVASG